jgi:hypothetical protein
MIIQVKRIQKNKDVDAYFGELYLDGVIECLTLERISKMFPAGTYSVTLDVSPHMQYLCPHLHIPSRDQAAGGDAGIRIHIANFPHELLGCIAVGTVHNYDALSNSRFAFEKLMAKLKDAKDLSIVVTEETI